MILINLEQVMSLVTPIVTLIFSSLSKKSSWFNNKYLKYEHTAVGVISSIIYVIVQDKYNLKTAIFLAISGILTGTVYNSVSTKKELPPEDSSKE